MTRRPVSFARFLLMSAAAACGAIAILYGQSPIATPAPTARQYVFPPVGLGSTETASITVVNTALALSAGLGNATPQSPSCSGTISFSDSNRTIGSPTPFQVGADQFKTVTLPFASAGLTGIRGEIQGMVSLNLSSSQTAPCALMFSLEIYDSTTGATHAVLSNSTANVAVGSPPIRVPFRN
jgi:hypothetical protein